MCVALAALDAQIRVVSAVGERMIPMSEFHRLPGETPDIDTNLRPGELITAVDLPPVAVGSRSVYRKVRDRASYAFALVCVAIVLDLKDRRIRNVRIALGGVAHKPWRAMRAEALLNGQMATDELFGRAIDIELADARSHRDNAFKIPLARRTVLGALSELAQGAER
jgi:xanthine dehydrogenase YagS FAD-binding subunit